MYNRKVILVTDGDRIAQHAIEIASANIGGRCISASAGNPTFLSGEEIIGLIKMAEHDPVVVMVDDKGKKGIGPGESAMKAIINDDGIDVLGVVVVSSYGKDCNGIVITCSVNKYGEVINGTVDKYGNNTFTKGICGDTVSVLRGMNNLIIVNIGDPGKMDFYDDVSRGAPVTTKALIEVMSRSGYRK